MANEFKHGTVGTELTQAEWEAVGTHVLDSQATGDIIYASSSSQLSRLAVGAANTVLNSSGTLPQWSTTLTLASDLTALTVTATGDTSAGDNATMGYTAGEGLILTGQGSTNDITLKNDADGNVMTVATGGTTVTFPGIVSVDDTTETTSGTSGSIHTDGGLGVAKDIYVGDDLLFASAAVVNWNSGDVTLTHAAGKLTFGGDGAVELDFNNHEMTNVDIDSGNIAGVTLSGTISGTPTWASSQAITLSTAAQGSITSVGTLSSLTLGGDLSFNAALDIHFVDNTNRALTLGMDGGLEMVRFDSRNAVSCNSIMLAKPAPTIASASNPEPTLLFLGGYTTTLTGTTTVTNMAGISLYADACTVTDTSSCTVTTASQVFLRPPVAAGSVTITNNRIIDTSVAGCFLTAGGVWTDASSRQHKDSAGVMDLARVPELLDQVQIESYRRWTDDGDTERFGVIAEDVPEFLASQDRVGVAPSHLANFALASAKYLMAEVDQLKAANIELRAVVEGA